MLSEKETRVVDHMQSAYAAARHPVGLLAEDAHLVVVLMRSRGMGQEASPTQLADMVEATRQDVTAHVGGVR